MELVLQPAVRARDLQLPLLDALQRLRWNEHRRVGADSGVVLWSRRSSPHAWTDRSHRYCPVELNLGRGWTDGTQRR